MSNKKAVMYGAGNIGRGFIGQLFNRSGFDTAFIDVNPAVIEQLNTEGKYPIRILHGETYDEVWIDRVSCVDGRDNAAIAKAIAEADVMATAVGVNILKFIMKPLAEGIRLRFKNADAKPLNIIICENLIGADTYLKEGVAQYLEDDEKAYLDKVGFVEASIGRMVPIQTPEMQGDNPLRVCVESYDQLPVDREAFRGEMPEIVNMLPFSPFEFFIKRKLFLHNMGHALTAYLGCLLGYTYIYEAIENETVKKLVKETMDMSAKALSTEYNVPIEELIEHVDDLIFRFGNRQLKDTVARVGNDLNRKLNPNDRLVGPLLLEEKLGMDITPACKAVAAALHFTHDELSQKDHGELLREVAGLKESDRAYQMILDFDAKLSANPTPETLA